MCYQVPSLILKRVRKKQKDAQSIFTCVLHCSMDSGSINPSFLIPRWKFIYQTELYREINQRSKALLVVEKKPQRYYEDQIILLLSDFCIMDFPDFDKRIYSERFRDIRNQIDDIANISPLAKKQILIHLKNGTVLLRKSKPETRALLLRYSEITLVLLLLFFSNNF